MEPTLPAILPELPVDSPAFSPRAQQFLEEARRAHPWLARFSQGYVVHGYQAVEDLLTDDEHLVPGIGPIIDFYGLGGTMWARFMAELLTSTTGPTHNRLRKSVAHAFTPRHANRVRPLMRKVIATLLDEWAPRRQFDFTGFAALFPVTVMCGLLGVSAEPVPRLRRAIEEHLSSLAMDVALKPVFLAAFDLLWDFTDALVNEREASATLDDDALLDAMVKARQAGRIDATELRFMLLMLLIAGYDTSKNQLSITVMLLMEQPALWDRCAQDIGFCGSVVEESLRHTSIATPFRAVATPFSYRGERFAPGDLLVLAPPLAGRDPLVYPDPMRFDPERANASRHLAFGRGPHICLGQYIARAQLQEGIHLIAQRLQCPRPDGGAEWGQFLGAWGLKRLPVICEPR